MQQQGPEHQNGWRKKINLDEGRLEIFARHHTTRHVPRGSEMVQQMARGRPLTMAERTEYEWIVLLNGRNICNLRQRSDGTYFHGRYHANTCDIEKAAVILLQRMLVLGHSEDRQEEKPNPPSL